MFNFNILRRLVDFTRTIYFGDISLNKAINRQKEMERLLRDLEYYRTKNLDKIESRKEVLPKETPMKNGQKKQNIFLQKKYQKLSLKKKIV